MILGGGGGGAKLYNPDTMELFCDKHAPGLFNELQQVIRNDTICHNIAEFKILF